MRIANSPSPAPRRLSKSAPPLLAIVAVCLAAAGCGGSTTSTTRASHTASPGSGSASSHAAVATTKVPGYGTALATPGGAPLYVLSTDPTGGSRCTGACAKQWPPLAASGTPKAGGGVSQSLLSSFKRSDGTTQVLYNGHALYTHRGSGAASMAGTAANGGIWYLIAPSGKPIKSTTGSGY